MVYIQEIIQQAKERSDQENSTLCSPEELIRYANHAYSSLYDILVDSFDDIYAKTTDSLVADVDGGYVLPIDFYKLVTILSAGNVRKVTAREFFSKDRTVVPAYNNYGVYCIIGNKLYSNCGSNKIIYAPIAKKIESEYDEIDGVNGWEEYLILSIAIKMMRKEESDTRELQLELGEIIQRINQKKMDRDLSQTHVVSDVRSGLNIDSYAFRG